MLAGKTQAEIMACVARGEDLENATAVSQDPATGVVCVVFARNPRKAVQSISWSLAVTDSTVRFARMDYTADGVPVQLEIHPL